VFHIAADFLPEARQAIAEIGAFMGEATAKP
jgi:hypothetical protein